MTFTPQQATIEDLEEVLDLLADAAAWVHDLGHADQWCDEFWHQGRRVPFDPERIRAGIGAGWTYVLRERNLAVATVTINAVADPDFWTDADAGKALYLSKMAVRSDRHHRGLGRQMIEWANDKAAAEGAAWLRLDAWKSNEELHLYYKRQGFQHLRTAEFGHRRSGALFQREVPYESS